MTLDRWTRLAPLSGIVAVGLQIVAFPLTGASAYRPSPAQAVEILSSDPAAIQLGVAIGGFYSLFFLVLFVGSLAGAVGQRAGDLSLTSVALAGGVIAVVALALGYRYLGAAAAVAADSGIGSEAASLFYRLYHVSFSGFLSLGLAALLGGAGLASLRSGLLPEWLGAASVAAAVGLLTPLHWLFEGLALAWIVAVSVLLYRGGPPGEPAAAEGFRLQPERKVVAGER